MKQDPTIREPRFLQARFCDLGSIIGSVIGGLVGGPAGAAIGGSLGGAATSLIGGSQAASAAEEASDAQVRAAEVAAGVSREALGFQREMYNVGRSDQAPYRATGYGALQTLNNIFLPGGHPMVQMQGRLNELQAQKARLMSASSAWDGTGAPTTQQQMAGWTAQRFGDGGGEGREALDALFTEEFGHAFGDAGGAYDRGVESAEAYEGAAMNQYEQDYGGREGGGGERDTRSAREQDRDRDQSSGAAASQSGPR